MRVMVIGGSNSIKAGGWTAALDNLPALRSNVINHSIGGVPSMMGYYRLISAKEMVKGDVVLWEYALNDQNHIDARSYNQDLLLRFCEHTILYCQKAGLRFIPLIFASKERALAKEMTPYRRALRQLFEHYGLDYLDVTQAFPEKQGRPDFPPGAYADPSHYKEHSFICKFIARRTVKLIAAGAGTPGKVPPVYQDRVSGIEIVTAFDTGEQLKFANSRLSVASWVPGAQDNPLSVLIEGARFRLIGFLMVCTSDGGAFRVSLGGRTFAISASYREDNYSKPMMKLFTIDADRGEGIEYPGGTRITMAWETGELPLQTDYGFCETLSADLLAARKAQVVGLIIERLTAPEVLVLQAANRR